MMTSTTNWFDLPSDVKINILSRIGLPERLENAQKVCTDWYKVCKDPCMWKVLDIYSLRKYSLKYLDLSCIKITKFAIDRSQGQMVEIVLPWLGRLEIDKILFYVADRARQLKRLTMLFTFGDPCFKSLAEALKNFSLLEELIVHSTEFSKDVFSKEVIKNAGLYCPLLKTLIVDQEPNEFWISYPRHQPLNDEIAVAVGENLHGLRHLKLINTGISNIGLKVIMDGCCQLESLDLSLCRHIDLNGDVVKRCSEQIKHLTLPYLDDDDDDEENDYFDLWYDSFGG